MNKADALAKVAEEIAHCKMCHADALGKPVPGEGNPDASVVFVGEAPGKQEAATGRPFIGRSGKLLRETVESIGLHTPEVFITSVGKYLPKRGTPTAMQIAQGREHLLKQLAIIHPQIIVLLGSVAAMGVLGEKIPVKSLHGTTRIEQGETYFLTIHPAAALRFASFRTIFSQDFRKLQELLQQKGIV